MLVQELTLALRFLLELALHLPRGGAAEGRAARRWRAPFRSTSLRAEEPAANDAAGPKNGQAGKVVPGGHWAASGADFPRPTPARTRRGDWEGPCQISRPTARFLPETASRRETRTTHRPTSYEPLLPNFVSDRRRPRGERCPTLRWPDRLETAPKETIVGHFAWFLAVFSARKAAFAAAFFAMRRPTAGAQPGLPLGAWHSSANLSESLALECQPVSPSASKTASVNSLIIHQKKST